MRHQVLIAALFCGLGMAAPAAAAAAARPNVLFIMTDQQFAEAMSSRMGTQYLNTPAMDSLARSGASFTRAYTANPICMPARNSIFTGRYPHETGITHNELTRLDPAEFVSMGTYFRQAGYDAGYSGKWHLAWPQKDPATHGFRILRSADGPDGDARIASAAVSFLSEPRDKPFLLIVSLVNPHNVCQFARGEPLPDGPIGEPPAPDLWPPPPSNLAPPVGEPDGMTLMRRSYHATTMFPVGGFKPEDWRRLRWAYYRMIEKVDREIGRVLETLRRAGLEDRTLVVFTSDHGECAGAHGFNQKTVLYEESVRVPLILSLKGTTRPVPIDRLVQTGIDILPTMLDFAGIPIPPKLPGRSLRRLASGMSEAKWREYVVVGDDMAQGGAVDGSVPVLQGRMLRTERFKYCLHDKGSLRESLVDLRKDPGETLNLAANPAFRQELTRHRELLFRFAREQNDTLALKMLADGPKVR